MTDAEHRPPGSASVKQRRIDSLPFTTEAVTLIAETFAVEIQLAPFRFPGGAVYQLKIPGLPNRPDVTLMLWPSIGRVDASSTSATLVFTDVATVDLVEDLEVLFRRTTREYLIVARGGKMIVRS